VAGQLAVTGPWLKRWVELQEAVSYIQHRPNGALLVEGDGWRVERGPGTDITIVLRTSRGMVDSHG
jgi:hypothetical protein